MFNRGSGRGGGRKGEIERGGGTKGRGERREGGEGRNVVDRLR